MQQSKAFKQLSHTEKAIRFFNDFPDEVEKLIPLIAVRIVSLIDDEQQLNDYAARHKSNNAAKWLIHLKELEKFLFKHLKNIKTDAEIFSLTFSSYYNRAVFIDVLLEAIQESEDVYFIKGADYYFNLKPIEDAK